MVICFIDLIWALEVSKVKTAIKVIKKYSKFVKVISAGFRTPKNGL